MTKTFFSSSGATIKLGRELGRGGEGAVFELVPDCPFVAKVYLKPLNEKKQDKLRYMPTITSARLVKYVAWPQETITDGRTGPVVGYLMPKVAKHSPVQMLYSPAHRRQDHPKAAWDFLIYTARNVAAAFEVLHNAGHVLGDVNQGNVMVASDSTVVLIDSDSFQINAKGTLHYCEVGVAHFTPPELQGISSFSGIKRSSAHDNFGLALLIFHILFGGRHPYSGVPLRNGVGDALETDIKNFRYAYAKDAAARGISPPPRSIPLAILPDDIERMFHAAFTESGAKGQRPTAQQWVGALDRLRQGLTRCATSKMHLYPGHMKDCPWCVLERQGVVYFVDLGTAFVKTNSGFDLVRIWAMVEAVQPPKPIHTPHISQTTKTGTPIPSHISTTSTINVVGILSIVIAIIVALANPKLFPLSIIAAGLGWYFGKPGENTELRAEHVRRKQEKSRAQQALNDLVRQAKQVAGPEGYRSRKDELTRLRDEYRGLADAEKKELLHLQSTAEQRQRQKFLEKFFIDSADISGIGPARKATLRSFGIETAADVKKSRVMQVKGFGESLTRGLTDWKSGCERRFVFNPSQAVSTADKNAVRSKYGILEVQLEKKILEKLSDMNHFVLSVNSRSVKVMEELEKAAGQLAQAEANFDLIKLS